MSINYIIFIDLQWVAVSYLAAISGFLAFAKRNDLVLREESGDIEQYCKRGVNRVVPEQNSVLYFCWKEISFAITFCCTQKALADIIPNVE